MAAADHRPLGGRGKWRATRLGSSLYGFAYSPFGPFLASRIFGFGLFFPHLFYLLISQGKRGNNGQGNYGTTGRLTRTPRKRSLLARGQTGYTRAAIDGGANLIVCAGQGEMVAGP